MMQKVRANIYCPDFLYDNYRLFTMNIHLHICAYVYLAIIGG